MTPASSKSTLRKRKSSTFLIPRNYLIGSCSNISSRFTTQPRSGNDRGTSYRSAIFYTSEKQKRVAEETIADVNASGLWPGKVVTEVKPASDFWEGEPEHQDYLERYPHRYTCHYVRPDWKLDSRRVAQVRTSGADPLPDS